jgi:hypothetical protein
MGDSVPKHTGPISLTDTHLEPSVLRTRPTTTRENRRRWKGLIPRDTQAACRFNCLASNSTPFFQMVNRNGGHLSCQGETCHRRPHPFLYQSNLEIAEWSRPSTGRYGGAFE